MPLDGSSVLGKRDSERFSCIPGTAAGDRSGRGVLLFSPSLWASTPPEVCQDSRGTKDSGDTPKVAMIGKPSREEHAERAVADYAAGLRQLINKFRRKFN